MNLETAILQWDGKSADDIRQVHKQYAGSANYLSQLTPMVSNKTLCTGASWLLKAELESGAALAKEDTRRIIANLCELDYWQQKLHILQIFEFISIEIDQKRYAETFLRACLSDDNKLVRAWAYNGFFYLAKQYEEFQPEAAELFDMALRDEVASVKARVRKLVNLNSG